MIRGLGDLVLVLLLLRLLLLLFEGRWFRGSGSKGKANSHGARLVY